MLTEGINFLYIAFELTLFYILALALYKISKQYLIPFLYQQIREIKDKENNLKNKRDLLQSSKKNFHKEIKEQQETFEVLEGKIKIWETQQLETKEKTKHENKKIKNKIDKKREVQVNNLGLLKTQKIVIPKSIKQAYREIEDLYGGEKSLGLLKELIHKIEPKN